MKGTKRNKQVTMYLKRLGVAVLAIAMSIQSIAGSFGGLGSAAQVQAAVTPGDYIDLENGTTELYQGETWSGSDAILDEDGKKATITVDNFGTEGSNGWGIQYMVKDMGLKKGTEYQVEFDITSTVNKEVFIKLDDSGLIGESINLVGGEKYHYSQQSDVGTPENSILYFALGRDGDEEENLKGIITIENVSVNPVEKPVTAVPIGVNREGTNVKFQLDPDVVSGSAITYYAICDSEEEANKLNVGHSGFTRCEMIEREDGIWEGSDDITTPLMDGQIIRYYFNNGNTITTPINYIFSIAKDYDYDNQEDLIAEGYTLVWNDEFEGTELDTDKWSFQIGTQDSNGGPEYWGNQEEQYYTDSNHKVEDGKLIITARKESKEGMPYTSTRIRTVTDEGDTLFATRYGRIEARMKLPTEEGLWPAFWMLPEDSSIYGTWAASGELDIMEARGRIPDKAGGTIHFGSQWPNNTYYGKEKTLDSSTDIGAYHLYSVEWEPGKITWLIDDEPYFSTGNFWSKDSGNGEKYTYGAPFDVPFYLILNLAVGGTFDGDANLNNANFPADMEVDYVRAYKKSDDYYENLEENLTTPETDRDSESFETPAYQPTGIEGDYVKDTPFDTLKTVTEVDPEDTSWQFFVGDFGGEATVTKDIIDDVVYTKTNITKGGNFNYAIQLIKHFPFASGYTYEISFDGKASSARDFLLKPSGDADNGWAGYGESKTVKLTTDMTHYTYQFTMDKDSDPTARLEFDMGLGTGDVWIGNVVVKQVEPEKVDTTDCFKNPELNGGNHIYNGTFDQGEERLAFWHSENVEVKVPGVINPKRDPITGDDGDFSRRAFITTSDRSGRIYQNGIWLQQSDIYQLNLNLSSKEKVKVSPRFTSKDGSKIYMKESFEVPGNETRQDYTLKFAMPKGITEREAVFVLEVEKGNVSVDNIRLVRTTNNNVIIDYSDVDLEPVKPDSTGWINNWHETESTPAANEDGVITSKTEKHQLPHMSMLFIPVSVKEGITYHLSFQAQSEHGGSFKVNIQEDDTWAFMGEETIDLKANEWQKFHYTIKSTLTNGNNPINLKFLLSGPNITPGFFKVKDVSLKVQIEEGAKDAPEDTIKSTGNPVKGKDYVIELKDGDYKTQFIQHLEDADGKALIMVNGSTLSDITVKDGKITIPASLIGTGAYTIELAMDGFNNIVLSGTVKSNNPPENNPGNPIDAAKPVITKQPVGGKYSYNGKAKSLSVSGKGDGSLSYQWYKNSRNTIDGATLIPGATRASYTPSTTKVGKTYYFCVVTNTDEKATGSKSATSTTNIISVEITKAANKITGVKNISKIYGGKAFTLKAKGKGKLTYKSSNPKVVSVNSKSGRVTIKGTGKSIITITAGGNVNYKPVAKKITITVKPKKVTVKSVKSNKPKSMKVVWKKDKQASGYKLQYSTSKKFKKAKTVTVGKNTITNRNIGKLKGGKTYYVRVRAYAKSGKTTLLGSWSAPKKVVVKK